MRETRGLLHRAGAPTSTGAATFEDLLVRIVVARHPASCAPTSTPPSCSPREPGEVAPTLTVEGLPGSSAIATVFLCPLVARSTCRAAKPPELVELLARLVISYFLAPSRHVDLGDPDSARRFIATYILPAFAASPGADPR